MVYKLLAVLCNVVWLKINSLHLKVFTVQRSSFLLVERQVFSIFLGYKHERPRARPGPEQQKKSYDIFLCDLYIIRAEKASV